MKKLSVQTEKNNYEILFENGLINRINEYINPNVKKIFIITDKNVEKLYFNQLISSLNNYEGQFISLFPGDINKNIENVLLIINKMSQFDMSENDLIISFGGGVITDIASLCANLYLNGINYLQIPTTLNAMVNWSLLGKNNVNTRFVKNKIGTFYPPEKIIIDPLLLQTLDKEHYNNGMAEIIKIAFIKDKMLFEQLENDYNISEIVFRTVQLHLEIMNNENKFLNFGNIIGKFIEELENFNILYGQALSVGMSVITKNSIKKGFCPVKCLFRLNGLLTKFSLPITYEYEKNNFIDYVKNQSSINNEIELVIPTDIGQVKLIKININEITGWII